MRRAISAMIALTLGGGMAALAANHPPPTAGMETAGLRGQPPVDPYRTIATLERAEAPETTTTTEAPPETTTTTEAPPATTTTIDWGPELCPSLPHPAHHEPCPVTTTTSATRARVTTTTPAAATTSSEGMSALQRRIGGCESSGSPTGVLRWTTEELTGSTTASGAFQILDSTWAGWIVTYGRGTDASSYSRAMYAPPSTQVTIVARVLAGEGTGPWAASAYCWS